MLNLGGTAMFATELGSSNKASTGMMISSRMTRDGSNIAGLRNEWHSLVV